MTVDTDFALTGTDQDLAEDFAVATSEGAEPGTVMILDENGALSPSEKGYDWKVTGVVSGAGAYRPGLILGRCEPRVGRLPIALVGKVYCNADAAYGSYSGGDFQMLTKRSLSLFLAIAILVMGMNAAVACNDFYVCAPNEPWRHTVDNGNFTNLYLYPNPDKMTWDQYTAKTPLTQPMTIQAIDGFVQALTDSSYFFPATQYHRINPPQFHGHQNTVQKCVDPVMAYAKANGNVLSREILADFVGCESSAGGNKSDQVNVILSPEFQATNDVHITISSGLPVIGDIHLNLSTQPATCPPSSDSNAFHTWNFGTANFTVIPTKCNQSLDEVGRAISHEIIETISDPAGVGYVHLEGGGDQIVAITSGNTSFLNSGELGDICQNKGLKNPTADDSIAFVKMPHSTLHAARYWSNADNSCQPQFMMNAKDILVDDQNFHRLGTGGGMTADLSYNGPFNFNGGTPGQPVEQLLLYTLTADDNLCNDSHLDFHVNLTGGRPPLDFTRINHIQYAQSWDNNEAHSVNIPVPAGLKLGDIASFKVHVQSGHCTSDIFASDDGWNVNRVAVFAYLAPDLGAAPVLELVAAHNLFAPTLATAQKEVQQGKSVKVDGENFKPGTSIFKPGTSNAVEVEWRESNWTDITRSEIRGTPSGNTSSKPRSAFDNGHNFTVTNIVPNTNYAFQVRDCDDFTCTDWSNTVNFNSGAPTPSNVQLVLQQGSKSIPVGNATIDASGSFSATITVGQTVAPGNYTLEALSAGTTSTSTPLIVVAANQFTPVLEFVDPITGAISTSWRVVVGGMVTTRGEGFASGPIKITMDTPNGAVLASTAAAGSPPIFKVTFPFNAPGAHKVVASQSVGGNNLQASAVITAEQIQ